MKGVCEGLK